MKKANVALRPTAPARSMFRKPATDALQRRQTPEVRQPVPTGDNRHEQDADRISEQVALSRAENVSRGTGKPRKTISRADLRAGAVAKSGIALPSSVRLSLEPHFGHDFSGVQVHSDERAAKLADLIHARAFTFGSDIFFGRGEYLPQSAKGLKLLAHELTHVVQQQGRLQIQRQVVAPELRSSVDVRKMTVAALQARYDLIRQVMEQFVASTPDSLLLEQSLFDISNELSRRVALESRRTFGDADVAKMREHFINNATSASPKSCIACMNDAVRLLIGDKNQKVGSEVEKTMAKMQASGHAGTARVIEFEDRKGRITKGTLYPEKLHKNAWDVVLDMAGRDVGWSVFGMSLMDGYHSVTLSLDSSDPRAPRVYWSDQWSSKGGWLEYDRAGLNKEITRLIQQWWNDQPENRKHNTRVTLWRLNP